MKLYRILIASLLLAACNGAAEKKNEPATIGPVPGTPPLDTTASKSTTPVDTQWARKGKTISLDTVMARKKAKGVK